MCTKPKYSDAEVISVYEKHKSIWRAGDELGVSGQTLAVRLRKLGHRMSWRPMTEPEVRRIKQYYRETPPDLFNLSELARELDRTRQFICRYAGKLGLTNKRRPPNAEVLAAHRVKHQGKWKNRPHPRGMAGKKHSAEVIQIVSEASKRSWATQKTFRIGNMSEENLARASRRQSERMAQRPAHKNYTRAAGGKREDLGDIYFRSSWEANYARYLNLLMKIGVVEEWEFEPTTFWFDGVRRGVVSYRPDFRVKYKGDVTPEYVEVKGWETAKDRTKWRRMKKYHPEIKLVIVGAKEYYAIRNKWSGSISTWETAPKKSAFKSMVA